MPSAVAHRRDRVVRRDHELSMSELILVLSCNLIRDMHIYLGRMAHT